MKMHGRSIWALGGPCLWVLALLLAGTGTLHAGDYEIEIHERGGAFEGTTLFADNSRPGNSRIVEVDMDGNKVWEYRVPKRLYGSNRKKHHIVMDVERLPNHRTLFTIQQTGIFEVDPEGTLVWSHRDPEVSHDVDRLANGNTLYVRGWVGKGEEHVLEVDPDGWTVWAWDAMKSFDRSPYDTVYDQGWMHVNAVTRLDNGNTFLSLRNFNLLVELDSAGDIQWSHDLGEDLKGKKKGNAKAHPHEPEILPGGNILVALTAANLVVEIPKSGGPPVWEWHHPSGGRPAHIRDANRLPNGNTLIVEAGRILELSREGTPLWILKAPSIGRTAKPFQFLYKAQRIGTQGTVFGH
ncbi:MAG: aryl-sulfate sulfotransferase [Deltaproteobacteria bacterium]|nr:aryl-sulfate sulfotransferase [Deltaproteobacteria bacterium]